MWSAFMTLLFIISAGLLVVSRSSIRQLKASSGEAYRSGFMAGHVQGWNDASAAAQNQQAPSSPVFPHTASPDMAQPEPRPEPDRAGPPTLRQQTSPTPSTRSGSVRPPLGPVLPWPAPAVGAGFTTICGRRDRSRLGTRPNPWFRNTGRRNRRRNCWRSRRNASGRTSTSRCTLPVCCWWRPGHCSWVPACRPDCALPAFA